MTRQANKKNEQDKFSAYDRARLNAIGSIGDPELIFNVKKVNYSGEQRLALAALEEAFEILQKGAFNRSYRLKGNSNLGKGVWADTLDWVKEQDPNRPFSLDWICYALNLDVDFVRRRMLNLLPKRVKIERRRKVAARVHPLTPRVDEMRLGSSVDVDSARSTG